MAIFACCQASHEQPVEDVDTQGAAAIKLDTDLADEETSAGRDDSVCTWLPSKKASQGSCETDAMSNPDVKSVGKADANSISEVKSVGTQPGYGAFEERLELFSRGKARRPSCNSDCAEGFGHNGSYVASLLNSMTPSQKIANRFKLSVNRLPNITQRPRKQELLATGIQKQEQELKQHLNDLGIRNQHLDGGGVELCLARFFADSTEGVQQSEWKDQAADVPDGWTRIKVTNNRISGDVTNWERAYHGTTARNVGNIIDLGLQKPGTRLSVGRKTVRIKTRNGMAGAGSEGAVYCSPSLWCSAHPDYSPLEPLGEGLWLQIVCEVRVKPGCYTRQSNTLSSDDWDPHVLLDPNWSSNRGIEWVVHDDQDIEVVGVLVRQLGRGASASRFGMLAQNLKVPPQAAPGRVWKNLLQSSLKEAGYVENEIGSVTIDENVATWHIPAHAVELFRPRERFLSRKLTLEGIGGLVLIFWPRGDTSANPDEVENCSLFILGLPPGFFSVGLTIGNEHREFAHEFTDRTAAKAGLWSDMSFGYSSFCRTSKMMKDIGANGLTIKATMIARESTYFGPGLGKTLISNGGQACTWTLTDEEMNQLLPRQRAWTKPLEMAGFSNIKLLFFRDETARKTGSERCSVYVVLPIKASVEMEISICSWKQHLKFDADGHRGEGWGYCKGFTSCCVLKDVRLPGKPVEVKVKFVGNLGQTLRQTLSLKSPRP